GVRPGTHRAARERHRRLARGAAARADAPGRGPAARPVARVPVSRRRREPARADRPAPGGAGRAGPAVPVLDRPAGAGAAASPVRDVARGPGAGPSRQGAGRAGGALTDLLVRPAIARGTG